MFIWKTKQSIGKDSTIYLENHKALWTFLLGKSWEFGHSEVLKCMII